MYPTTSPTQNQFVFHEATLPDTHTHTRRILGKRSYNKRTEKKLTEKAKKKKTGMTLQGLWKLCVQTEALFTTKTFIFVWIFFWCCASAVVSVVSLGANVSQTISSIPSYKHFLSFIWAAQQQAQTSSSVCSWDYIDSGGKWSVCSSSHDAGCSAGLNSDTSNLS